MFRKIGRVLIINEWLVFVVTGVILLRIPTLFEPYWYGDEGIYLTIGQALNRGVDLYSQIHDNKPPLLYWLAMTAGGNLFWFKFILMIWGVLNIIVFSWLSERVFGNNKKKIIAATILFALLTTVPIVEGNIANAEIFFLLPLMGSMIILWKKDPKKMQVVTAGLLIGIASLFKVPAIIEFAIWPLVWIGNREKKWFKNTLLLGVGAGIPLVVSGIYFWFSGSLKEYFTAAWLQNIPYLSTWKTAGNSTGIYSVKGRLIVIAMIWSVILGGFKKIGRSGSILGLWFFTALFAALLSGRPYPHYLLQVVPAFCLLIPGLVWGKRRERLGVLLTILILAMAVKIFNFYSYSTYKYYANFIQWVTGRKDIRLYRNNFDANVNAIYDVAEIIKSETLSDDKIFIWGDIPMVYALANRQPLGKYTAKYHVLTFDEQKTTLEILNKELPKLILVQGETDDLPGLQLLLNYNYMLEKNYQGIQIFRKYKNL